MENKYEKNALWKHSAIYLEGELAKEDLKMEIVEGHRTPLDRQIHEGVEIDTNGAEIIMNSKGEWGHCMIPRVVIEIGDTIEVTTRMVCREALNWGGGREREK